MAGHRETLQLALDVLGRRGRLVLLTTFPNVAFLVEPRKMVLEELCVLGSRYASRAEVVEAGRLVADGFIRTVISMTAPLAELGGIIDALQDGSLIGRAAVVI